MTSELEARRDLVFRYHERTKHHPARQARSLGYLDWDTQPDPFRRFDGAPRFALDPIATTALPHFDDVIQEGNVAAAPLTRTTISQFLFDSLALSARKSITVDGQEHSWHLRCNPSSGNLHPTEGYLILPWIPDLLPQPAVCHYRPLDHSLELRRALPGDLLARFAPGLVPGAFLAGLTSIFWRESWKYGERAFRYCQHDVGHAIAGIAYAAAALGWRVRAIDALSDADVAQALAIEDWEGIEAEHSDLLLLVEPATLHAPGESGARPIVDPRVLTEIAARPRLGAANALSPDHVEWDAIDAVAVGSSRSARGITAGSVGERRGAVASLEREPVAIAPREHSARVLFRQRRSAVALDGKTGITREAFLALCERTLPRPGRVPFATFRHAPAIHPVFFVHRVEGLSPGIYLQPRSLGVVPRLRNAMRPAFVFEPVEGSSDDLPLYLLDRGDVKNAAAFISCHQEIAGAGAFAVGMLAEFEPRLRDDGPDFYRTMHHEAGALGQSFYLEAEALGIRGTGIGCFFDDSMHELLGLQTREFQTIYHFTVGGPVDDPRIVTAE